MDIQEMYKKRRNYTIKGVLFLLIGLIGLAIEKFAQAKEIDGEIKKLAIENDNKPDFVILNYSCDEKSKTEG